MLADRVRMGSYKGKKFVDFFDNSGSPLSLFLIE